MSANLSNRRADALTLSDLDRIVQDFCDCSLPLDFWTHEAHLKVGIWHLLNHPFDDALRLLRTRIRAYNEYHGSSNTDQSGYHETITRFYLLLIQNNLRENSQSCELASSIHQLLQDLADPRLIFEYYTNDVLYSVDARRAWVEPDLQSLELS